ncbi:hypothetical protein GE09DRAFT_364284 [Coniochaeta sp. 2T2.1]|nr:hypothetical protein GE09DRAFT_364284 [Coniochaeta sp. 2T2.1]
MAPSPTLLATARAYLAALSTISADGLAAITTPSFTTTVAPSPPSSSSSSTTPVVVVTRDSLIQRYRTLQLILLSMNVAVRREWPPDEGNNTVVVWTRARAEFRPEITGRRERKGEEDKEEEDWTFNPETLFVFTMDQETGEKVESLFEFQDSVALRGMDSVFGRAMERLAAQGDALGKVE